MSAATPKKELLRAPRRAPNLRRRTIVFGAIGIAAGAAAFGMLSAPPVVYVFKNANCDCCERWISHLRRNGFIVDARNADARRDRARVGVPAELDACHSALVAGYALEGHIPAADIRRLLGERPVAVGLAVAGMPRGSPGMEREDALRESYDVMLFARDGTARVFAHHAGDDDVS
jgi:hypothetical protein